MVEPSEPQTARQFLGQRPPTLPPIVRWTLGAGLLLFFVYGVLLVVFYYVNRAWFHDAWQLHVLTFTGREPAMLAVYTGDTPAPWGLVAILGVIIDLSHLFVILGVVWFLFAGLARVKGPDRFLASLEKSALKQRRFMRRWGLAGLAVFYWLPGYGTGAFAISAIGVMARIPLTRLVTVLALSATLVSLFWATFLHFVSKELPKEGWWTHIPLVVIVLVVLLAIYSGFSHWRTQHILLLPWPVPDRLWRAEFESMGMRRVGDCLEVDSNVLGALAGVPAARPRRVRSIAELMVMPGMRLDLAKRLEERGVVGMEALAQLPVASLVGAIEDSDHDGTHDGSRLAREWKAEAHALEAAAGEAWTGQKAKAAK